MPPEDSPSTKRGAPKGNKNARKHGFYARELTPDQVESLGEAMKIDDLKQEIALMRVKLASLISQPNIPPDVVFRAVRMLSRMIEIQQRFHRI